MVSFLLLIVGFVLLVWGADHFVTGASSLAKKMGIPSLIIGLTVVAFGTSAPELAVSLSAGLKGANEIALGNVLGSNIFNLLVVAGGSAIISPLVVEKELLNRDWALAIATTSMLIVLMLLGDDVSRIDAVILLLVFAFIMYTQIKSAKKGETLESENYQVEKTSKVLINILAGLACIIAGGQIAVYGATEIARMFGLSETLIGLTIVAIGTSLPELVTSLIATKKGENSIAVGNVIGSNLFNVLLILGTTCLIKPINVQITAIYDTAVLIFITGFMFVLAQKSKLNRKWGIILVFMYFVYTAWLIIR